MEDVTQWVIFIIIRNFVIFIKIFFLFHSLLCFLELPECILRLGVLEINIDFIDKTDIFIHHKGT